MSANPDVVMTDLYGAYNLPLNEAANQKYQEYLQLLAEATKPQEDNSIFSWIQWENHLKNFYRLLINDVFQAAKLKIPAGMEVYFAGSLAKKQATEYSDLDAFVLFSADTPVVDREAAKEVFNKLNNLCQRFFNDVNQLYPDPIGINPARLSGTVDEVIEFLNSEHVLDKDPTVRSILTSKPIFGRYQLGEELRDKIRRDPNLNQCCTAIKFYEELKRYPAPKKDATEINIKSHLLRPLDFFLMGLREEFNLYNEDGSHLTVPGTINLLRQADLLDNEYLSKIEALYYGAMEVRFAEHKIQHKEADEIRITPPIQELLDKMADLRDYAEQRCKALKAQLTEEKTEPVKPSFKKIRTEGSEKEVKLPSQPSFLKRNAAAFVWGGYFLTALVIGLALGLSLSLTGVFTPFGITAFAITTTVIAFAAAAIGIAVLGYGLFKGVQAIVNCFRARNDKELLVEVEPRLEIEPAIDLEKDSSKIMKSGLGISDQAKPIRALSESDLGRAHKLFDFRSKSEADISGLASENII